LPETQQPSSESSEGRAGTYPIAIVMASPNYPGRVSRTKGKLTTNPYYEFSVGKLPFREMMACWNLTCKDQNIREFLQSRDVRFALYVKCFADVGIHCSYKYVEPALYTEHFQANDVEARREKLFRQILKVWYEELPMAGFLSQFVRPIVLKNGLHNYVDGLAMDTTTSDTNAGEMVRPWLLPGPFCENVSDRSRSGERGKEADRPGMRSDSPGTRGDGCPLARCPFYLLWLAPDCCAIPIGL